VVFLNEIKVKSIFFNKKALILFTTIILFAFFGKTVFAVWNNTFYNPGDTLNPECLPTDTNCDVRSPLTSLNIMMPLMMPLGMLIRLMRQ